MNPASEPVGAHSMFIKPAKQFFAAFLSPSTASNASTLSSASPDLTQGSTDLGRTTEGGYQRNPEGTELLYRP